jgi:single-stranded-DNA-specific exonuclease
MAEDFTALIEEAKKAFTELDRNSPVRIVAIGDADGICGAAILSKVLRDYNVPYALSFAARLSMATLKELAAERYGQFFFIDCGSSMLSAISKALDKKKTVVFDHSPLEKNSASSIICINPYAFGMQASGICSAAILYLMAKSLGTGYTNLSHFAIIGALGDNLKPDKQNPLLYGILKSAIKNDTIDMKHGLLFFGSQSKPLHRLLEHSTEPYLPGITGSEKDTQAFLERIGIPIKKEQQWRKAQDLSNDEIKLLAGALGRYCGITEEQVLGKLYLLKGEKEGTPLRDCREFAAVLRACSLLGKHAAALGSCLGDQRLKEEALKSLEEYKIKLTEGVSWCRNAGKSITRKEGFVIIDAKENIHPGMLMPLASLLSHSKDIGKNTVLFVAAHLPDNTTAVALAMQSEKEGLDIHLGSIAREIAEKINGEWWGQKLAAGMTVPTERENECMQIACDILSKKVMEEIMV